jgi:hypothetical protein
MSATSTIKKPATPAASTKPTGPDRSKGHKARFWTKLLDAQPAAKLSDVKLAALCKKEYPEDKTNWEKKWPAIRRSYNKGFLFGQKKKPAVPAIQYDSDGKLMFAKQPGRKPGTKVKALEKKSSTPAPKPVTVAKKA